MCAADEISPLQVWGSHPDPTDRGERERRTDRPFGDRHSSIGVCMKRKVPVPLPAEFTVDAQDSITVALIIGGILWVIKKAHDEKHLNVKDVINYAMDLVEAALYSIFYFMFALYFGGIIEDVFPHYESHSTYWELLFEVLLQACVNTMVSQIIIDLVQRIPVPDLGQERKALAARNGGIIFGMSLYARQNQWKAKVAHLAKLEDALFFMGLPVKLVHR